jgi:hypothetical protein
MEKSHEYHIAVRKEFSVRSVLLTRQLNASLNVRSEPLQRGQDIEDLGSPIAVVQP